MKFHVVTEGPHVLRMGPGLWGFYLKIEVSAVKKSLNLGLHGIDSIKQDFIVTHY